MRWSMQLPPGSASVSLLQLLIDGVDTCRREAALDAMNRFLLFKQNKVPDFIGVVNH